MTDRSVRWLTLTFLTVAALDAQALTQEEFNRVSSIATIEMNTKHTFVAHHGRVRESRWTETAWPAAGDIPGFTSQGKIYLSDVSGESGSTRTLYLATSENYLYEATVRDGQATSTLRLLGNYSWIGGNIQGLSAFQSGGTRYAVVLMSTGDIWWITQNSAQRIAQTHTPATGGPRFISAVLLPSGRADIYIGPYFFGGIYRIRDALGAKIFDFVTPIASSTLVAMDAHRGADEARIVFGDTSGNVHLITNAANDQSAVREDNIAHLDGPITGLHMYSAAGASEINIQAIEASGKISAFGRSVWAPYFDVSRFDTYDPTTGANDSFCIPGSLDWVGITGFNSRSPLDNSVGRVFLPYPDRVRLEYSLVTGGSPISVPVTAAGLQYPESLSGYLQPKNFYRELLIHDDAGLNQTISVDAPCGRLRRVTSMSTVAATNPTIQRFSMEPHTLFQYWLANIDLGDYVTFAWQITADTKCDPRVIITGRADRDGRVTYVFEQAARFGNTTADPQEDTDYQLTVECRGTGRTATAPTVLNVNINEEELPSGAQSYSVLMSRQPIITTSYVPFFAELRANNGRLTGLYNPSFDQTLLVVRAGNFTTAQCNNPNAVVAIPPRTRVTNLAPIFNVASPSTALLQVSACLYSPSPISPEYAPYITFEYNLP